MDSHTPPPSVLQTPQVIAARRRIAPPSSARLSTSFSLNPADTSQSLSDVSLMSPTKGRAAFLSSAEQGHMGMGQISPRTRMVSGLGRAGPSGIRSVPGSEPRIPPATRSRSRLGMADDAPDAEDDDEPWNMVDSMRGWRQDSMLQQLYETAVFWGDKILSLTGDVNDAFWLAQAYMLTGNYLRAERLLSEPLAPRRSKGKGKAAMTDEDQPAERPFSSTLACRSLLAQTLMAQEKYEEALDVVGPSNPFREPAAASKPCLDDGLKLHSGMCYLRGMLHLRLSSLPLAKESLMEALVLDVKNYEAFRQLIEGRMLSPSEEWEFVNNLAFRQQLPKEAADFVRLMYVSKLRKDDHVAEIAAARRQLAESYDLSNNCDLLVAEAEELFARYKWEDCYVLTSEILQRIPGHPAALPVHLACMYHIPRLGSSLFMLAHDLVEQEPHMATSWYAVGLWYFLGKRWSEARRYLSKACLIDDRFVAAWITFAHSYALEGEHDQAITAYSTAHVLFPGTHLPYLFIGQEYLQLSQAALAEEHFLAAAAIHATDPLLLNELGVAAYNREDYPAAIDYFERAVAGAGEMQGSATTWSTTHCNLGHALRLQKRYAEARAAYAQSIRLDPLNHTALASQAMLAQLEGDTRSAIRLYHSALSLSPQDPVSTVLLEMALQEQVETLNPTTLPGLPAAIARADLDPFAVPKGNAAFGPLPIETDPLTLEDAGDSREITFEQLQNRSHRNTTINDSRFGHTTQHRSRYGDATFNESSAMEIEED